jgi:hypothetical protein
MDNVKAQQLRAVAAKYRAEAAKYRTPSGACWYAPQQMVYFARLAAEIEKAADEVQSSPLK